MDRETRRQFARKLRATGMPIKDIATRLGVSISTAHGDCAGVLPKGADRLDMRRQDLLPAFVRLYSAGIPVPEIAQRLGVPATTLYDWRRRSGVSRNSRAMYVTDALRKQLQRKLTVDPDGTLRKRAVELYLDKQWTTVEIADEFGVTSVTVAAWLEEQGVSRRRSPLTKTRVKLREANLGAKRYNWKGGVTPERIRARRSMRMRDARKACFERDHYTCRMCGKRGGQLCAHHIWPFHRYPDKKFEVANLMTLCRFCHDRFHKAAGGHVRPALGPFFPERKSRDWARKRARLLGDKVREGSAPYLVATQNAGEYGSSTGGFGDASKSPVPI